MLIKKKRKKRIRDYLPYYIAFGTLSKNKATSVYEWYIMVGRNANFFAAVEWLLFKYFNLKRKIPCGRNNRSKHMCCMQPYKIDRINFNEDRTEMYCKCCGTCRGMSNHPFDIDDENEWISF